MDIINNSNESIVEEDFLECEKKSTFNLLIFVAGFYGAFTYSIRGGVFCNAQTANFVLFAMALGNGKLAHAAYYLIPMTAYLLGAIVSEALPKPIKKQHFLRWDTILIIIEIFAVIILGFIPESAPVQISQITINFICSMQYNTYRQAQGIPMATTFCTNHVRQVGINLVKLIQKNGDKEFLERVLVHGIMLLLFVLGGILSTILCRMFLGKAIWFALIPLIVLLVDLLHADLNTEKDKIENTPRGH